MKLFFVPNNPEKTVLVSASGVPHYKVDTTQKGLFRSASKTIIQRCSGKGEATPLAEVQWLRWTHPIVKSHVFDGTQQQVDLRDFLYKIGRSFTTSRYFLGNDEQEYKWKVVREIGHMTLTNCRTKLVVARYFEDDVAEGHFQGQRMWCLQMQPSSLDIDLVVLTLLIMEKRRRDRLTDPKCPYREEGNVEGGAGEC
ncbi:hypothetical protein K474DRAFT_1681238 [Panus rudis PR-1116 ss-1]|nr:hypothetical protein K474DRAFT_1681238 [Panus rudis PR-1116 ss-1]